MFQTHVVVTNTLSFSPFCDEVLLMENGQITAAGSYETIAKNNLLLSGIETHAKNKESKAKG